MSLHPFFNEAMSPWMKQEGPEADIVLSSRVRLARNLKKFPFSTIADEEKNAALIRHLQEKIRVEDLQSFDQFEWILMDEIEPIEKLALVEKHLISPSLASESLHGAVFLNRQESVSVMVNEEDHIRIQCLYPGFQLDEALQLANKVDDFLEERLDYAFDEKYGYLTSCPTNVGTGLRASVMMHLPVLTLTGQINRIIPAINQVGFVVRGIYGEGSEARGNLFQVSNQMTLGKTEKDMIRDLEGVTLQLIQHERRAREQLLHASRIQLEDKVFRSYGLLENSRIMESKEAAKCLSDVRLGIDLGIIKGISRNVLSELIILTQPGFLQKYAGKPLTALERDILRATLIRERLQEES